MATPRALIIDDTPLNGDVLVTLLRNAGIDGITVESPRYLPEVLDQITNILVVFLDLEFPNHSGFDLLKDLKSDPRLSGIPIVAYSVHTSEIDQVRKAGFHSFLGKPLDPRRFPSQLERILNNQPVWEI
jgi:CheY-like chemotaxis protein